MKAAVIHGQAHKGSFGLTYLLRFQPFFDIMR